jgi:hypothetical protein
MRMAHTGLVASVPILSGFQKPNFSKLLVRLYGLLSECGEASELLRLHRNDPEHN